MVADEKEEIAPEAPADESLPSEAKDEPKKKTMLLAVIIAVILVIAAVAAVIGLGLLDDEDEPANVAPSGGARATTATTIFPGGNVSFESLAVDTDGTIVNYTWKYGNGNEDKSPTMDETNEVFDYAGNYLVYHEVEDDDGATGSNEAAMVGVNVLLVPTSSWANDSEPIATMTVDKNVIPQNTTVVFNMTGSSAPGCFLDNSSTNSSEWSWYVEPVWSNISAISIDFGDGSAVEDITPAEFMAVEHEYTAMGHYVAELTVTSEADVSSVYMITVHVLTPEGEYIGTVKNPDAYVYATIGEPDGLDPALNYESAGGEVLQNVYETLIWYAGSDPNVLAPMLALEVPTLENGLISEDALNYTFNLRTDVLFHDGTNMTSEDVIYSFQRALQMHDPSSPVWMLEQVLNDYLSWSVGGTVSDYLDNSNNVSWIRDVLAPLGYNHVLDEDDVKAVSEVVVVADDADTVTFRLTHKYSGFLKILCYTVGSIVSKEYVEANGGVEPATQNEHMNLNTCGTGAYKLAAWEVGSKIHLTRFDDYWGDAPALKDVFIVKSTDVNTRILMLQSGDADGIDLPVSYENVVSDETMYDVTKGMPTFDLTFMAFNFNIDIATANTQYGGDITVDFFDDIDMRRAFTHLINYTLYLENVARGNAIQPNGVVPFGMLGYDADVPVYEHDLVAAEEALQNTSWWASGFTIPLFYNAGNLGRQTACEMMKSSLEAIDPRFTATTNGLEWTVFLHEVYDTNGFMPVYSIGWGPDYADPDDYTTPMLDSAWGTYPYYTGYANATIDGLVRAAASELDEDIRADLYSQIAYLVHEDCPYIWLTQPNGFHVERSWVQGWFDNPMFSGQYYPVLSKATGT